MRENHTVVLAHGTAQCYEPVSGQVVLCVVLLEVLVSMAAVVVAWGAAAKHYCR